MLTEHRALVNFGYRPAGISFPMQNRLFLLEWERKSGVLEPAMTGGD